MLNKMYRDSHSHLLWLSCVLPKVRDLEAEPSRGRASWEMIMPLGYHPWNGLPSHPGKLGLTYLGELKQSQVVTKAASSVTPCFFSHVSLLYISTWSSYGDNVC